MAGPLPYASVLARPSRLVLSGAMLGMLGLGLIFLAGGFLLAAGEASAVGPLPEISPLESQRVVNARIAAHAAASAWTWLKVLHVVILYGSAAGCFVAAAIVLVRSVRQLTRT